MFTNTTRLARTAVAVVALAAAAAGGIQAAQAAGGETTDAVSVVRAATPQGGDNGGLIVPAETPRIDARPAPPPAGQ